MQTLDSAKVQIGPPSLQNHNEITRKMLFSIMISHSGDIPTEVLFFFHPQQQTDTPPDTRTRILQLLFTQPAMREQGQQSTVMPRKVAVSGNTSHV